MDARAQALARRRIRACPAPGPRPRHLRRLPDAPARAGAACFGFASFPAPPPAPTGGLASFGGLRLWESGLLPAAPLRRQAAAPLSADSRIRVCLPFAARFSARAGRATFGGLQDSDLPSFPGAPPSARGLQDSGLPPFPPQKRSNVRRRAASGRATFGEPVCPAPGRHLRQWPAAPPLAGQWAAFNFRLSRSRSQARHAGRASAQRASWNHRVAPRSLVMVRLGGKDHLHFAQRR